MNIALPVLLLIFGGLTLWLLTESQLKWYLKTACIATYCIFTTIFWSTIHSYLGWPANESDMPEKVLMHWVIIKEPNKFTEFEGAIYILAESAEEETNSLRKVFGYNKDRIEPNLHIDEDSEFFIKNSSIGDMTIEDLEKEAIIRTLKFFSNNRRASAKSLGMSERTLYRKINQYGLERKIKS